MKHFTCRSLGNDCDFEIHAETVDDMMGQIIEQLHLVHHLKLLQDEAYEEAHIRAACADMVVETPCV